MSKSSAPAAPDPYTSAAAQAQYSDLAASYGAGLNDVNTVGPTGSSNYSFGMGANGMPTTTQTTNLSPAEQGILNQSEGIQSGQLSAGQNVLGQFNTEAGQSEPTINPVQYGVNAGPIAGLNTSNVPGIAPTQDYEQYGQNTALAGEMAALQPSQSATQEQLQAQLINSGIHPGDPAYETAMSQLSANQGQQDTQAAGAAITAGTGLQSTQYGEEANTNQQLFGEDTTATQLQNSQQSQAFGEGATNAQLNNSAGTTALQDYAQETGIPLNELSSLLSSSQVAMPSTSGAAQESVQTPDIMSAFTNQYNGQLAQYNAGVSSSNAELGDAATLGTLAYLALA